MCVYVLYVTKYIYLYRVVQAEIIDGVTDLLENETLPSTFTCEATGEPIPVISWYFNGVVLNVSNASIYNISNLLNGIVIKSSLTIVIAQSSDVGIYTCHAENFIGSDISSGVLTVNGKPIYYYEGSRTRFIEDVYTNIMMAMSIAKYF